DLVDAVEDIAGFVRRDGVGGLAERVPKQLLVDGELFGLAKFPDHGKLGGGQTEDLEEARTTAHRGGVVGIDLEVDLGGSQLADDAGQASRREGGGTGSHDLGRNPLGDRDIEVGGGKLESQLVGSD